MTISASTNSHTVAKPVKDVPNVVGTKSSHKSNSESMHPSHEPAASQSMLPSVECLSTSTELAGRAKGSEKDPVSEATGSSSYQRRMDSPQKSTLKDRVRAVCSNIKLLKFDNRTEIASRMLAEDDAKRKGEAKVTEICMRLWQEAINFRNSKFKKCLRELLILLSDGNVNPGSFLERLHEKKFSYSQGSGKKTLAEDVKLCKSHPGHFLLKWSQILTQDTRSRERNSSGNEDRPSLATKELASQLPNMPVICSGRESLGDSQSTESAPLSGTGSTEVCSIAPRSTSSPPAKSNRFANLFKKVIKGDPPLTTGHPLPLATCSSTVRVANPGNAFPVPISPKPGRILTTPPVPKHSKKEFSHTVSAESSLPASTPEESRYSFPPSIPVPSNIQVSLEMQFEVELAPFWNSTKYKALVFKKPDCSDPSQKLILFIPTTFYGGFADSDDGDTAGSGATTSSKRQFNLTAKQMPMENLPCIEVVNSHGKIVQRAGVITTYRAFEKSTLRREPKLCSTILTNEQWTFFSDHYELQFKRHLLNKKEYSRLSQETNSDQVLQCLLGRDVDPTGERIEYQKNLTVNSPVLCREYEK